MAQRLVLHLYDRRGAGAQGFLWRAEGNGNTLYLLGTIHVDRDNIYPLSGRLREIIAGADDAIFEVDFGDKEDTQAFMAMQDTPRGKPAGPCERCALPGGGVRGGGASAALHHGRGGGGPI